MLKITTKTFKELTTDELYALLQLRSEVFVVEQDCVYQDIDYTRLFKPGDYFNYASIGRVIVAQNEREHKYGYDIMNASINAIKEYYNETTIKISAQTYLKKFYNNLGFEEVGEGYLEDGIPHIGMIKN